MPTDLRDLIDGTLLRRAVVPTNPLSTNLPPTDQPPKRRTQSDRMRELRTMRAEMREQGEIK